MQRSKKAFTLIELLVVIAIIAILAAILFPVFAQAKQAAKKTTDLSNNKNIALGITMYAADFDDTFPLASIFDGAKGWTPWQFTVNPYVKSGAQTGNPGDFIKGWDTSVTPNRNVEMGIWRSPIARNISQNNGPSYGANALVMGEDQSAAPWVDDNQRIPSLTGSQAARPGEMLLSGLTENFTWSGSQNLAFEIPVEWTRPEQVPGVTSNPANAADTRLAAIWYRDNWVKADLAWENRQGPGALGTWFCTWGPYMCKGLRYSYAQSTLVNYVDGHAKSVKLGSLRVQNIFPQETIDGVY